MPQNQSFCLSSFSLSLFFFSQEITKLNPSNLLWLHKLMDSCSGPHKINPLVLIILVPAQKPAECISSLGQHSRLPWGLTSPFLSIMCSTQTELLAPYSQQSSACCLLLTLFLVPGVSPSTTHLPRFPSLNVKISSFL